jgi:enterochelin esterase family protein
MKRIKKKIKTIIKLEEEIKTEGKMCLEKLHNRLLAEGNPIIEDIEGDNENNLVTFIYFAEEPMDNVLFIPPVDMRNIQENNMDRLLDTNVWYITYKVRNDVYFGYYFCPNDPLDDDWEKRGDNLASDKFNDKVIIFKGEKGKKDIIRPYVVMPKAEPRFWTKERSEIPKGELYDYHFQSKSFKEPRRIRVYTPFGYKENTKPYGLLVLTDGDEYINMLSAKAVLDNLIADKKIPPIVVLFIDSTEARIEELKCSDAFGNTVVNELIPWVRDNYNISKNAEETIIGGLSLGGLTAAYLGLKYSEVFGNVLSQSGSFWYKPEDYEDKENSCWMSSEYSKIDKLPVKFYLNVGVLEPKSVMIDTNINFKDLLLSKGYDLYFEEFKSGHDYLCWGETLANGLISLIGCK